MDRALQSVKKKLKVTKADGLCPSHGGEEAEGNKSGWIVPITWWRRSLKVTKADGSCPQSVEKKLKVTKTNGLYPSVGGAAFEGH
ncbi:hypothetical protein WKH31_07120 [Metabacillus indicus]|uniref:hypothetical protein n=1 Tax=Metabacillus indicus TaxID=246786 RepID=UPI00317BE2A3